jgi:hypothetical protein
MSDLSGNKKLFSASVIKLIQNLEMLRREGRIDELSEELAMKSESLGLVASLKASSAELGGDVLVTVEVKGTEIIGELANSLLKYLNRDPYFREEVLLEKNMLLFEKKQIVERLQESEALKNSLVQDIKEKKLTTFGFNPMDLEQKMIEYELRLEEIDSKIKKLRGFEMLGNPEIPAVPVRPRNMVNIIVGGFLFLLLGFFLSFFIEWIQENRLITESHPGS